MNGHSSRTPAYSQQAPMEGTMWNGRDLRLSRLMPRQYFAAILVAIAVCGSYRLVAQTDSDRPNRVGLPQDWSHNHVVFSNPPNLQSLVSIRQDPRLLHQLLKRNALGLSRSLQQQAPETESVSQDQDFVGDEQLGTSRAENQKGIDWSMTLGATGSRVARGMFPAKYS